VITVDGGGTAGVAPSLRAIAAASAG
jgi:hypothetical protein